MSDQLKLEFQVIPKNCTIKKNIKSRSFEFSSLPHLLTHIKESALITPSLGKLSFAGSLFNENIQPKRENFRGAFLIPNYVKRRWMSMYQSMCQRMIHSFNRILLIFFKLPNPHV